MAGQTVLRRKPQRLAPSIDDCIAKIHQFHGLLGPAAAALGLSRSSLDRMVQRSSKLAWAVKQAREKMGDFAESKLFELIAQKDQRSIQFYLSSVHRRRGYGLQLGETIQLGDTNTTITLKAVNIIAVPSGMRCNTDGSIIDPQMVIEHDGRTEDDL